ncbi:hypothetical protein [Arthrobacter sp. H16F315]|uniref:hypothetical protein n=1 Tax=Arthrobacter sp. H16F315 TaxID=2955314 RepID=UPI00209748AF|nr:hypothetical protein [Arthrobacter sp. H16F315]MDD1475440.1 hypothetical protein [Arthrobacter sp. H16F315]
MTEVEPEFDALVRSLRDVDGAQHRLDSVAALARDLAGRFELQPLLGRILNHATSLLGCESGSIALVNEASGTYTKRWTSASAARKGRPSR